ncbi:MAG TPA: cupredoxin domain-containing protein [Candidatus Limnocylindrales bacterium]|jgi:plastocyanin|nr:cupredoxin domain-containing protein [Candidatus Limnocylindrales bacterium]
MNIASRLLAIGTSLVVAIAAAACSTGAASPPGTPVSLPPDAPTIHVSASNRSSFDQSTLSAPSGTAFAIVFENRDQGVPHDVAIKDASGTMLFQGDVISGPASRTYAVGPLPAGSYTFFCIVHQGMQGTLTIK